MRLIRRLITWNERLSYRLGAWTDRRFGRHNGVDAFHAHVASRLLVPGLRVLDVGGGKFPLIDSARRLRLGLHVTGLDISAAELAQAPPGSYDRMITGDVATAVIDESFDLIVSRMVLEHVPDTPAAIANLAGALAAGGTMVHFIPCANAGYALLNRLLGNRMGRRLLWSLYPGSRRTSGFPAYYRCCTPRQMRRLCQRAGLVDVQVEPYYVSDYLRFCVPLHAVETLRQVMVMRLRLSNLAETFTLIARKPIGPVETVPAGGRRFRRRIFRRKSAPAAALDRPGRASPSLGCPRT